MSKETYSADIKVPIEDGLHISARPEPVKRKPWWKLGGKDTSFVSVNAGYAVSSSSSDPDSKTSSVEDLGKHVWETEESKEIYKPIEGYEGAHRFDPSLKWTPEEEKRLVKSVRPIPIIYYEHL